MSIRPTSLALAMTLSVLSACGGPGAPTASDGGPPPADPPPGDPGPPDPDPSPPAESVPLLLLIDGPPVVALSPGEERTLEFRVLDQTLTPIDPGDPVWQSGAPERVAVGEDGTVRAGAPLGHTWIHVESRGLRDSVGVWVQPPEEEPSRFEITLFFSDGVPPWYREGFRRAAERWERVVRAPLPEIAVAGLRDWCGYFVEPPAALRQGTEVGIRIWVETGPAGAEGREASAISCSNRGLPRPTAVTGRISLNEDRFTGEPPEDLEYLTHHEMGHVFGLVGVVRGDQPDAFDLPAGIYRGHLARAGHVLDTGRSEGALRFNPESHWTSFVDLMGARSSRQEAEISRATIGALMDLGYPAAWYGAGPIEE